MTRPSSRPTFPLVSAWVPAFVLGFAGAVPLAAQPFDHGRFDGLLKAVVSEEGWVDYDEIRTSWASELKTYLQALSRADVAELESSKEKMAFWINAYNAVCMQTLLDHDLPRSVPKATFFGANIFTERTYSIAGKARTLDDIEHGILREEFKDNRIHAAVVCGASSCPRLRREAYTGAALDAQLDEEARRWIQDGKDKNGKRKNRLDKEKRVFYASKIFSWFQEDFGGSDAGVLKFVAKYASEADRAFLQKNSVKVKYLAYDWSLNSK